MEVKNKNYMSQLHLYGTLFFFVNAAVTQQKFEDLPDKKPAGQ